MRSSREQRLEALFDEAVELQAGSRAAFLYQRCGDDAELRADLERLLARDASAADDPAAAPFGTLEPDDDVLKAGTMISGRYTLVRPLGAGGMGVVWMAEQTTPKRQVALKIIRPGLLSRPMLRRFELEANVLARLQHPGIAQIHEAGTYDDGGGRPFFAMELVDGLPLLRYAAESRLSIRQRLELFALICDAVQHAHQKSVIHRDLKPGNILVTRDGRPKILDFGVARATDSDLQISTIQTSVGQLIGTVPYMSPEQVTGRTDHLDTRSDVYALGVILYQLLSDRLPYNLDDRNITAAARVIAEDEPTPLMSISRSFRGDLNTIALKALEKEPQRRYQSASDLAEDVRRFMNVEPILARPASTMYHLRKFARRNKGLVGAIAAALVLLLAGITGTTMAMFQAQAQRDNAERQTRKAQAVTDFLNEDLLSQANPLIRTGADVKLRDVLNEAAKTIEGRFFDAPDVEAAIRVTLGQAYFNLADYTAAAAHLNRAADLQDQIDNEGERLKITLMLGHALLMDWKADEAEPIVRENVEEIEVHFGAESLPAARAHGMMGLLHKRQARYVDAEVEYRRALEIFAAAAATAPLDEESRRAQITNKNNLALVLRDQERFAEAEVVLREVVDDWIAFRGPRHSDTAYGMNNLGDALWHQAGPLPDGTWDQARLAEAEALFREAFDIRRETLGDRHPHVYFSLYGIGLIESDTGRFAQAEQTMRTVLAFRERTLDPLNRDLLIAMSAVGTTLEKQGRHAEAVPLFREALRRSYEAGHDFEMSEQRMFRRKLLQSLRKLGDHESIRAVHAENHSRLEQALESPSADKGTRWVRRANTLASQLLTCEVQELRDPARALVWARRADERVPDEPSILNTLALALAENGRLEEAMATQQRAISLLPESVPAGKRKTMQDSLETLRNRLQGTE